jgi:hypothetical protein
MKYLFLLFLLVFSCASQRNATAIDSIQTNASPCPEDGDCTFEVLSNQSFSIEKDGIGALYPKVVDGNTIILKFEYKRNDIPNTVDGQYRELVYLELSPEHVEIDLKDGELINVKALFARLCFCRGQTGYYIINQGQLSLKKLSEHQYHLKMRFKIDEVPQVISEIDEVFSIK